ncbi:hypothetical protein WA1_09345 [Scytonema hofmannii PCC 7110]|uniref:Uncharacterized protein n=1 Tax=Scytonema hofmannii PCC 7110 TaxID=128403 RepID=A0A139WSD3_9CYAN|nr:hypothetical protein [Scytonema hofmannii]KYC35340.1 hypothetical protein WA1_09345 [Scytonema hofmannii PCC 7110]
MALTKDVKRYLAYWFQLGKKVVIDNGAAILQPREVVKGNQYSDEFEECWRRVTSPDSGDCYLEGTHETIAELLSPAWEVAPCARCDMPIPARNMGMPPLLCPCFDLTGWPNTELPQPRCPVDSQEELRAIRDRLLSGISSTGK